MTAPPSRSAASSGDSLPTGSTLPTGTVTFLFTDIEGSTSKWENHPQAMQAALQVHNSILREAIAAHGGLVFKTIGDAFQAVFTTAPQALLAAVQAQQGLQASAWNEAGPLWVRMGLHTGEAELDPHGDEYAVSHAKNRAARVMSAGYGGQVLLSLETSELVQRSLPEGISLKDLGQHRLKGLTQPERLFQVLAPGLRADFPPLDSLYERPHNLPSQLTSFVGRQEQVAQTLALLGQHRLVSLTGTGGVGKTRLALQTAAQALPGFPDGVYWIALAPVASPERLPQVVANTLGLRQQDESALHDLVNYLHNQKTMLVLDNCEHLLEASADLATALLQQCPDLRLLTTTREALNVPGEYVYRVPALSVPNGRQRQYAPQPITAASLAGYEAVQLFIARAQTASPGFTLTDTNAPSIASICQRLDGIPLALELAAARLRVLSPDQIATRLDDIFRLLSGGSRSALPHHQTLRLAIDWSYDLLDEPERCLLRRLSVFSGGWTIESAEGICADDPHPTQFEPPLPARLDPADILDLLTALVDKSLVNVEFSPDHPARYYLLETLRQYTREKLLESGEAALLHRRHMHWFADWVEAGLPNQHNAGLVAWMDALETDFDDLRAAREWAFMENCGPEISLRLASSLYRYWWMRGNLIEAQVWLGDGLRFPAETPEYLLRRARAYYCFSWLTNQAGEKEQTVEPLQASIQLYRQLGDLGERGLVEALAWVSANIRLPDGLETVQTYLAEAETLGRRLGQIARWELGMALWLKSLALTFTDQAQQAESCARESWSLFLDCGDRWNAGPLNTLGIMELRRKNYPAARQFFEQALECFSQSEDNGGIASSYTNLTQLMLDQGDLPAAIRYFRQGAKVWHAQGNRANVAQYLNTSTFICLTTLLEQNPEQHLEPLASLISVWSASETYSPLLNQPLTGDVLRHWWPEILKNMQENNIITLPPETRQTLENRLSSWLDELGQAAFYQAVLAGQSLSFFQALELLPEELTPMAA